MTHPLVVYYIVPIVISGYDQFCETSALNESHYDRNMVSPDGISKINLDVIGGLQISTDKHRNLLNNG